MDLTSPKTATLDAARQHARAQASTATAATVRIPSTSAVGVPHGVSADDVVWDEVIPPGGYASRPLPRSTIVRITDTDGDACVQLLVWDAVNPAERLNAADTVKVQWQAYLGPDALLLSDMGRVLLTIVKDTSARHDALCGCSPEGRRVLCLGAAKLGLARNDVGPNISLFKTARVGADGSLRLEAEPAPGAYVELRAEVPVLLALANTAHPLDGRTGAGTIARVTAWRAPHPTPDRFRATSPERERAFLNTDERIRTIAP